MWQPALIATKIAAHVKKKVVEDKFQTSTHAWKLLVKIGPSKCSAFPSPLVQNLARPFFSCAKSKNMPGFHPLQEGNGTSKQLLAAKCEIYMYEGKGFF